MTRLKLAALVLILFAARLSADSLRMSDPAARALWQQTLAVTGGSSQWVPGDTMMLMEFLDRHGETDQVLRTRTTVIQTENGQVMETVVLEEPGGLIGALMPDGAMDPDGVSGASSDSDGETAGSLAFLNPFVAEAQDSLWIRSAGRADADGIGEYLIGWTDQDGTAYDGRIWIDQDDGRPVRLEVSGDSSSSFVRSIAAAVDYGVFGAAVLPTYVVSTMDIRYALVIRATIRMTLELADYYESDWSP